MTKLILSEIQHEIKNCQSDLISLGLSPGIVADVTLNSTAKNLFGRCKKRQTGDFQIEIMTYLNAHRTAQELKQTIMHEVIHTLPGCNNHGPNFQAVARLVNTIKGYSVSTRSTLSAAIHNKLDYRYRLICTHCGEELKRYHRKPAITGRHFHSSCGELSIGKLRLLPLTSSKKPIRSTL